MRVFIAEKPSLAKAIAAVLPGPQKRHKTYIQSGEANVVVWCAGHILTQYMPEDYDPRYKRWSEADLPIIPQDWKMSVAPRTKDLYQTIGKFVKEADIVVHAGDPDREGQLLVDEVLTQLANQAPVKRLLINDLNAASVKRALGKLEDNSRYAGLRDAALGRSRADWLYGLNLTRLYTVKGRNSGHSGVLSVGRVQTPVLGMVVHRDLEIEAFVSKPFYELTADLKAEQGSFTAKWVPGAHHEAFQDEDGRVIDRTVVEQLTKDLKGCQGTIASVKTQHKREPPPLPFSLPELQKIASKGRGLSPKKTLAVAQSLYEKHQVLTYPRSDCAYLPVEHWAEGGVVRDAIVQSIGSEHALFPLTEGVSLVHRGRCWNDKKVTAHHAIIPTSKWVPLNSLSQDERWIYEIVAHRYLLQFCVDREFDQTDVLAKLHTEESGEIFKARGVQETEPGWRQHVGLLRKQPKSENAGGNRNDEITTLPALAQGEGIECVDTHLHEKETTPPKHFTEATLLDAMTSIARHVSDPDIKKVLRETDGLGTPATQGGIIDILFKRAYLEKKGKFVLSTELGREMIDMLPEEVTLPDMTAHWELQLARIAEGKGNLDGFIDQVIGRVQGLTAIGKGKGGYEISPQSKQAATRGKKKPRDKTYPCPECGGRLRRIRGKNGFFWGCTNYGDGCRETRPDNRGKPKDLTSKKTATRKQKISVSAGQTCPECKKGKIQLRTLKNGKNAGKSFHGCSNFPTCRFFAWPDNSVCTAENP